MVVGLRRLCFRWGPSPFPKKWRSLPPQFSAHFYCGQTAGCIKMPRGMQVGLSPGDFVLDGDRDPSPKRGRNPQFSPQVYCGQTAGCINMSLSKEVGLSPRDCVLDGDLAPCPKRGGAPIFGPRLLWPNGCMDQDAAWYGSRPRPTRHCVRWGPSSPSPKEAQPLPNFGPMSVVAKRLNGL